MDDDNKRIFLECLAKWMQSGHNVAVITRGIDEAIGPYFDAVLGIAPIMNDYKKGFLSIYAPDEETFYSNANGDFWAQKKTEFVADIIRKIGSPSDGSYSIFMDDTVENVAAMKLVFPNMVCEEAEPGEYQKTFDKVNSILPRAGGLRKRTTRRKQTRRNKRK